MRAQASVIRPLILCGNTSRTSVWTVILLSTTRFQACLEVSLVESMVYRVSNRLYEGQKIKLVIAACLWNNPQVWLCRFAWSASNLTFGLDLCPR